MEEEEDEEGEYENEEGNEGSNLTALLLAKARLSRLLPTRSFVS